MKRVRLRTILLAVNLLVLSVPLTGIYAFHIYENQLVRQAEAELIAQGAYASAFYTAAIDRRTDTPPCASATISTDTQTPALEPVLNLGPDQILPSRPEAVAAATPPDNAAYRTAQEIYPVLAEAARVTLAGLRIVDCHGIVVAGRNEVGQSLYDIPEVHAALEGRYRAVLRQRTTDNPHPSLASISRGADIRVFVAMPVKDHDKVVGALLLSRTPRDVRESLYQERHAVLAAASIVLAVTLLLALLTSRAISQPIAALRRQAQSIERGGQNLQPLRHPITAEIADLSESLVTMGQTLSQRAAYIRDFAAHVSHEFKTPLTSIQGALELVQEHRATMEEGQLERFLSNAVKDTERLKILVARLLELARADMTTARDESCDLPRIVAQLRDSYPAATISLEADPGLSPFAMPEDVVHAVLATLLANSVQHGATAITIEVRGKSERLRLAVRDNGSGISPANANKLFIPFFTTRREAGGTGLGLVISRALLAAYGATITCEPGTAGATFVVLVPDGKQGAH